MALPRYRYRDPLEVLEIEERKTCKGCIYKGRILGRDFCENPKRSNSNATQRCRHYTTNEEG